MPAKKGSLFKPPDSFWKAYDEILQAVKVTGASTA